jgi:hypothetical protein
MKNILIILSLVIITKEIYPQNLFSVESEVRVKKTELPPVSGPQIMVGL